MKIREYLNKKYDLDYWIRKDIWVNQNGEYVTLPHQHFCYTIARFFIESYNSNLKFIYPIYEFILHPIIKYHDRYYIKKLKLRLSESEYNNQEQKMQKYS